MLEKFHFQKKRILWLALLLAVSCGLIAATMWFSGISGVGLAVSVAILVVSVVFLILPISLKGVPAAIEFLVAAFAAFYLLELFTHYPWEMEIIPQLLNYLVVLLLFVLLYALCKRASVAIFVGAAICLFVGLANYYTMEFRDSPILPWDLLSVRVALSVTNNYTFTITWAETATIQGFLLLMILGSKNRARAGVWKKRIVIGLTSVLLLVGTTAAMGVTAISGELLTFSNLFTQWATYRDNGFFISFMTNLKYLRVEKPKDYSEDAAKSFLQDGAAEYELNHPTTELSEGGVNVIVVMNEAFSDLSVLHDFETSEDYMPFYHSLEDSEYVQKGYMYVSVCGGNTANTEYEFLTGQSMAFLPAGSVAYQQYINQDVYSLADEFTDDGYTSFTSHPYSASGWDRDEVYPFLGFSESFFRPDFVRPKIIRKYVSDASQYQLVEEKVAEKNVDGTPVFSFNVTMQNHGGYSQIYEGFPPTVKLTDISGKEPTENYLTLIKESDSALQDLIETYENSNQKTMIVFFGDHQPSDFVASCIMNLDGKTKEERTLEEQQKRYMVPYLVWTNYEQTEEIPDVLSANYLGAYVARAAGNRLSEYEKYILNLQESIPVITANIFEDADGNMYAMQDFSEADDATKRQIQNYRIVSYYQLFDAR